MSEGASERSSDRDQICKMSVSVSVPVVSVSVSPSMSLSVFVPLTAPVSMHLCL